MESNNWLFGYIMLHWLPYQRLCSHMTRDSCENDMFTNSNTAFINFNYLLKWKSFELYNFQLTTGKKRASENIMNWLSSEEATNFKARSIALAYALNILQLDGPLVSTTNAVRVDGYESTTAPITLSRGTFTLHYHTLELYLNDDISITNIQPNQISISDHHGLFSWTPM